MSRIGCSLGSGHHLKFGIGSGVDAPFSCPFSGRGGQGAGVTSQMRRCIPQSYRSAHSHLHCPSLAQPHHDFLVELGICPSGILWIHCQTDLKLLPRPSLSQRHESHISTSIRSVSFVSKPPPTPLPPPENHPRPSRPLRPSPTANNPTRPSALPPATDDEPRGTRAKGTPGRLHTGDTRGTTLTPKKKRDKWPTTTNPQSTTRSKSKT